MHFWKMLYKSCKVLATIGIVVFRDSFTWVITFYWMSENLWPLRNDFNLGNKKMSRETSLESRVGDNSPVGQKLLHQTGAHCRGLGSSRLVWRTEDVQEFFMDETLRVRKHHKHCPDAHILDFWQPWTMPLHTLTLAFRVVATAPVLIAHNNGFQEFWIYICHVNEVSTGVKLKLHLFQRKSVKHESNHSLH